MELVRAIPKHSRLEAIAKEALPNCRSVDAAVAYVHDTQTLLDPCWDQKKPIRLWARLDHTSPVNIDILECFLKRKSPSFTCKLIRNFYHPKVIWWRDFGAYIGSANLTSAAWFENVEAGIFFLEEELHEHDLFEDLEDFFAFIDSHAHPVTEELISKIKEWEESGALEDQYRGKKKFDSMDIIPEMKPVSDVTKEKTFTKRRNAFLKEWHSTLQQIRSIAKRVSSDDYRPCWVPNGTSEGTQADQFLHAYYYNRVKEGNLAPFMEHYRANKDNPEGALINAMLWWKNWEKPIHPHTELLVMTDWSPLLQELLARDKILDLNEDEFVQVCSRVHAVRDHSLRVSYRSFGLDKKLPPMEFDERIDYFGRWLFKQRAPNGNTPLDLVNYILYGGSIDETPERMFRACEESSRKIPHLGVSSLGEIIGWALPDHFPPRNGRTSKALKALGFDVTIHSVKVKE